MHSWIRENPDVRIGFVDRTKQMIPFAKEGILFGVKMGIYRIDAQTATIEVDQKRLRRPKWKSGTEADICAKKGAMLGKWFAQSGDSTTIFAMWGVRP